MPCTSLGTNLRDLRKTLDERDLLQGAKLFISDQHKQKQTRKPYQLKLFPNL
jgi:hypothetical protein